MFFSRKCFSLGYSYYDQSFIYFSRLQFKCLHSLDSQKDRHMCMLVSFTGQA